MMSRETAQMKDSHELKAMWTKTRRSLKLQRSMSFSLSWQRHGKDAHEIAGSACRGQKGQG